MFGYSISGGNTLPVGGQPEEEHNYHLLIIASMLCITLLFSRLGHPSGSAFCTGWKVGRYCFVLVLKGSVPPPGKPLCG